MRIRRETVIATVLSIWTIVLNVWPAAYANGGFIYSVCATLITISNVMIAGRAEPEPAADAALPSNVVAFRRPSPAADEQAVPEHGLRAA